MGIKDTSLDRYDLGKHSGEMNSLSLDHGVLTNVENCTQDDGYKYGVFTLLMTIMHHKGDNVYLPYS